MDHEYYSSLACLLSVPLAVALAWLHAWFLGVCRQVRAVRGGELPRREACGAARWWLAGELEQSMRDLADDVPVAERCECCGGPMSRGERDCAGVCSGCYFGDP